MYIVTANYRYPLENPVNEHIISQSCLSEYISPVIRQEGTLNTYADKKLLNLRNRLSFF